MAAGLSGENKTKLNRDYLTSMHSSVKEFIAKPKRLLIGGEWVEAAGGKTFAVYDPASGDAVAQVAQGEARDVDQAVAAARSAFENGAWRRMSASARGQCLWRLGDLIEKNLEQLAQLETLDNGKPLSVARAADVPLAADLFRYMAGWATKIEGTTIPISAAAGGESKFFAYTTREPVGVVGQIIPWNFPLLMAAWKIGPALAAGCTIVLKPAEQTPLSALRLGELALEAGIPPGVLNVITGFGETAGAALAAHHGVDKVAFTGSTEVGKLVLQAAGKNLKRVTLELGGKSPNVILKDADLEQAIAGAANAIFFNHGQCCCAGSRLYVERSVFDQVIEGVSQQAKAIKLGSGFDPATQMGPLVSAEQQSRVRGLVDSGLTAGAKAAAGGRTVDGEGYFMQPTVLVNTSRDMRVVQEEIFGPVVVAMPIDGLEDAIKSGNDTNFGLAGAIWTRDVSKAHRFAAALRSGSVWVNCYNVFDAALPFGGYKESGWGREMGFEAVRNYTEVKSVCMKI